MQRCMRLRSQQHGAVMLIGLVLNGETYLLLQYDSRGVSFFIP